MYLSWLRKYNLLIFDEIDSTNSEAIRLAKAGICGDFVIWAQSQTDGRGRCGRKWISEVGNFYASLLLNVNVEPSKKAQLSFVASLAVLDTINTIAKDKKLSIDVGLKWPNDVMVGDKKIAGILLETVSLPTRDYLAVGVGINVLSSPENTTTPATSLLNEGIIVNDSGHVLNVFMSYFDKYFLEWCNHGFTKTRKIWLKHASKLHNIITVDDGKCRLSGEFEDIDLSGNLLLKLASGQTCSLSSGEVFFSQ